MQDGSSLTFTGTLVITGAGRGIGRGYAHAFAERGAKVIVNDVDADAANAVVDELATLGASAFAVVGDAAEPETARSIVARAVDFAGSLDGVIVNASINAKRKSFADLGDDDLQAMLSANVFGPWRLLQAAWSHLAASGHGRILLTTSQAALYGMPLLTEYALAKGALLGLTRALAHEGARLGIRVNAIAPAAATRLTEETIADPGVLALLRELQPPELVAPLAVALMSDGCPTTGEIFLSGGAHAARAFIAETKGVTLPPADFTPENLLARWDDVRDETGYRVPRDVSETGDLAQKAEIMQRLKELGLIE
jgi:NAD(P)-dependent dehydrogenase (short-subunit alcohol dehydrogenase family)